ncbi:MAG: hypothetical protein SPL94_09895 [Oribacterium sp.]|nr:hypothetical protein [Oribacterium sp.]
MAKETRVLKVDSDAVNTAITTFEGFGWELISNQPATQIGDGKNSVVAENQLTFSRDKDAPWYEEIKNLEDEFVKTMSQRSELEDLEPDVDVKFHAILFVVLLFVYGIGLIYLLIYIIMRVSKKSENTKWHEENDPEIEKIDQKLHDIQQKSLDILNGKNDK